MPLVRCLSRIVNPLRCRRSTGSAINSNTRAARRSRIDKPLSVYIVSGRCRCKMAAHVVPSAHQYLVERFRTCAATSHPLAQKERGQHKKVKQAETCSMKMCVPAYMRIHIHNKRTHGHKQTNMPPTGMETWSRMETWRWREP